MSCALLAIGDTGRALLEGLSDIVLTTDLPGFLSSVFQDFLLSLNAAYGLLGISLGSGDVSSEASASVPAAVLTSSPATAHSSSASTSSTCGLPVHADPGPVAPSTILPPGEDPVFKPGDRVRTTGLRNRVDLNDRSGFILSFQNGRFAVSLAGCDRPVVLLPQKVLPCVDDEDSGSGYNWSSRDY